MLTRREGWGQAHEAQGGEVVAATDDGSLDDQLLDRVDVPAVVEALRAGEATRAGLLLSCVPACGELTVSVRACHVQAGPYC